MLDWVCDKVEEVTDDIHVVTNAASRTTSARWAGRPRRGHRPRRRHRLERRPARRDRRHRVRARANRAATTTCSWSPATTCSTSACTASRLLGAEGRRERACGLRLRRPRAGDALRRRRARRGRRVLVGFEEKPSEPRSTLAATATYLYHREHVPLVERYLGGRQPAGPAGTARRLAVRAASPSTATPSTASGTTSATPTSCSRPTTAGGRASACRRARSTRRSADRDRRWEQASGLSRRREAPSHLRRTSGTDTSALVAYRGDMCCSTCSSRAAASSARLPGATLCPRCTAALPSLSGRSLLACGAPIAWPVARCRECAGRRLAFASARAASSTTRRSARSSPPGRSMACEGSPRSPPRSSPRSCRRPPHN